MHAYAARGSRMLKHPKQLGFKLGLTVQIARPAKVTLTPLALTKDVVYVALVAGKIKPLKKGEALRVGQTRKSLGARWRSGVSVLGTRRLRPNERQDRMRWLDAANGKKIEVWVKQAEQFKIPYAKELLLVVFLLGAQKRSFSTIIMNPS